MSMSWSSWRQSLVRGIRHNQASTRRAKKGRQTAARRSRFECLEDRTVLSATFGSALSIGDGAGSDTVFDIAVDSAGNSYVTGSFTGTVDFDLGAVHPGDVDWLTSRGSTDAFVAKYAPDDSLVWVQRMGGDSISSSGSVTDVGRKIAVDVSGNVYIVGEFNISADFGATTLVSTGYKDGFVAKFEATGSFAWAKRTALNGSGMSRGVGVDASGNVYTLAVTTDYAAYQISKYTPSGQSTWSISIDTFDSGGGDLAVSAAGKVFVAGEFKQTVDFDPSNKPKMVSAGSAVSSFVLQLDTNGKFGWVAPFVGGQNYAHAISLDASGNVYVGGSYQSNAVDFDPGKGTTRLDPAGGAYIAKLNSSGGLVWARALTDAGSGGTASVHGLAVDAAGSVYATGSFSVSIDLDPSAGLQTRTTAGGSNDIFVVKLSASGSLVWGESFGGTKNDVGWGVVVDGSGVVHVAGYYGDIVDFDPSPLETYLGESGGLLNGFHLRLQQS